MIFEGEWRWLNEFRGTCIVANFFVASLYARNCIPAIKLLAISKTDEVDFFTIFVGEWGWLNVFRGTRIVANFLQLVCVLEIVFRQ